jgi:hypothetical protein
MADTDKLKDSQEEKQESQEAGFKKVEKKNQYEVTEEDYLNIGIPKPDFLASLRLINGILGRKGKHIDELVEILTTNKFMQELSQKYEFTMVKYIRHLTISKYVKLGKTGQVWQSYENRKPARQNEY